jgi:hypothetical protein
MAFMMKRTRVISYTIIVFFVSIVIAVAEQSSSRFGIDYVFPLDHQYQNKPFAKLYAEAGIKLVNFADIRWKFIEPKPPIGKRHVYKWMKLDSAIRHWQRHGFDIVMTMRTGNGWFSGPVKYTLKNPPALIKFMISQSDRLPQKQYMKDYEQFISSMVERYDGDGADDMPGLIRPVLHYQIGNEYGNPAFWTGTIEDYYFLLRSASKSAKQASREVQIIPSGLRTNDLFHNDPTGQFFDVKMKSYESQVDNAFYIDNWKRMQRLDEGVLKLRNIFNIVDAGGNGSWHTTSEGYFRYVRQILDNAGNRHVKIWDMETRNEPLLTPLKNTHIHMELGIPNGKQLINILKNKHHKKHNKVASWYRAEQSRITAKVFVTKFAAGNEKVFMGMPMDWDKGIGSLSWPNPFMGFFNNNARPWPAYYTLKILVETLDRFSKAEKIAVQPDIVLYRFDFPDQLKPVWVTWIEEKHSKGPDDDLVSKTVTLKNIQCTKAFEIPTQSNKRVPVSFKKSKHGINLNLTSTPVFLSF